MLDRTHKISEIVGAIALVASLIFVGIQVNQNTSAMRTASHQEAVNVWADMSSSLVNDDRLAELYADDLYPTLRPYGPTGDQVRLLAYLQASFYVIESHYLRWVDGDLPEEIWTSFRTGLFDTLTFRQSAMRYWNFNREYHSIRFQELVDEMIPRAEARRAELAELAKHSEDQ